MRYVALIVMIGLAVSASLLPTPDQPEPGPEPSAAVPPVSICPVVEGGGRETNVSVLSSVDGVGRITTFVAGAEVGALDFRTGGSGSVTVPASETGAVGAAAALIEKPTETTAAGVVTSSPTSVAAESCADSAPTQSFISGGSTAGESTFEMQLMNPYAGEAVVDMTVTTEAGIESDSRFDAVVVPALTSITMDLSQIIPGREWISVNIETSRGSVLSVGRQISGGEIAILRAVAPDQDWWLPVPAGDEARELLIVSPTNSEIQYQVDLYGPQGLEEAMESGVLPARGRVGIPLSVVTSEAIGVRVISTGPVVAALWISSEEGGLAATTGSTIDSPAWLLPGASGPPGGEGSLVVLNSGIEPVAVRVRSLAEDSRVGDFEIAPEDLLTVGLIPADGYLVEATGPVVALWTSHVAGGRSAAIGIPVQDG